MKTITSDKHVDDDDDDNVIHDDRTHNYHDYQIIKYRINEGFFLLAVRASQRGYHYTSFAFPLRYIYFHLKPFCFGFYFLLSSLIQSPLPGGIDCITLTDRRCFLMCKVFICFGLEEYVHESCFSSEISFIGHITFLNSNRILHEVVKCINFSK